MRVEICWIADGEGWFIPWMTIDGEPCDPPPPAIPSEQVIQMGYDLDAVKRQAELNAEDPKWARPDSDS